MTQDAPANTVERLSDHQLIPLPELWTEEDVCVVVLSRHLGRGVMLVTHKHKMVDVQ